MKLVGKIMRRVVVMLLILLIIIGMLVTLNLIPSHIQGINQSLNLYTNERITESTSTSYIGVKTLTKYRLNGSASKVSVVTKQIPNETRVRYNARIKNQSLTPSNIVRSITYANITKEKRLKKNVTEIVKTTTCSSNITMSFKHNLEYEKVSKVFVTSVRLVNVTNLHTMIKDLSKKYPAVIAVREGYLIVYAKGLIHSLALYENGREIPSYILTSLSSSKSNIIEADYALVSSNMTVLFFKINRLLKVLGKGNFTAILWTGYRWRPVETLKTNLIISENNITVTSPTLIHRPVTMVCGGEYGVDVSSYLTSLVCYHSNNILDGLREIIKNRLKLNIGGKNLDLTNVIWYILRWIEENIAYDYEKELAGIKYINNPLTTISRGKGTCIDYAILTSALLQSLNVTPTYILMFRNFNHAVAAISLNNTLFILDQQLPPIELQDYIEYILNSSNVIIDLIEIESAGSEVIIHISNNLRLSHVVDTYPNDTLPNLSTNVALAIKQFLKYYNVSLIIESRLKKFIEYKLLGTELRLYLKSLGGLPVKANTSLTKLYSPLFKRQWIRYLAYRFINIINEFIKSRPNVTTYYFWSLVSDDKLMIIITTYELPLIAKVRINDKLIINVSSDETIKSISLILYDLEAKPIAGLAPEGYRYIGIRTLEVVKWDIKGNKAYILLDLDKLKMMLQPARYIIGLWINHNLVDCFKLSLNLEST